MGRLNFSLRPVAFVLFIIIGILHLSSVTCRTYKFNPKNIPVPRPPELSSENFNYSPVDLSSSSSLSIVTPLEVLRQSMAAELARGRIREAKNRRVATNSEYLRRIGR